MENKEKGFLLILIGIFMLTASILISNGFKPNLSFVTNLQISEIVLSQGDYVAPVGDYLSPERIDGYYKNHIAVKTSHATLLSFAIILVGVWFHRKK